LLNFYFFKSKLFSKGFFSKKKPDYSMRVPAGQLDDDRLEAAGAPANSKLDDANGRSPLCRRVKRCDGRRQQLAEEAVEDLKIF
jgi:hypothetical protein